MQTGVGYSHPLVVPRSQDIRRAADVLNAGRKVAILIGAGALGAREEVIAVNTSRECIATVSQFGPVIPRAIPR